MGSFSTEASVDIAAPINRVWEALTNPKMVKQYFFGTNLVTDWQVGGPVIWRGEWEGRSYEDKGTVLAFDPPTSMSVDYWSALSGLPDAPENRQILKYDLSEAEGLTTVKIRQTNVATQEAADHSKKNWETVLMALKNLLESSK